MNGEIISIFETNSKKEREEKRKTKNKKQKTNK
jgi:hypothetical protein